MKTILCAVDIGSSQVKTVIALYDQDGKIEIIGHGAVNARGVEEGIVMNLQEVSGCIEQSLKDAKKISGIEKITGCIVNITGKEIACETSKGLCTVSKETGIVTHLDIQRAIENSKEFKIPSDHEILHILAKEYVIDNRNRVANPLGMNATRLEAEVLVITSPKQIIKNIHKIFSRLGLDIEHLVFNPIAAFEGVTSELDKANMLVIDIGAAVTDVAVVIQGIIHYCFSIPLGGNDFTRDLEIVFKIPHHYSELLKTKFGTVLIEDIDPTKKMEVQKRILYLKDIARVLRERAEEFFSVIHTIIKRRMKVVSFHEVVLTGGGSQLYGLDKIAEAIFHANVRTGKPAGVDQESLYKEIFEPSFSVAVGMIKFMAKQLDTEKKLLSMKTQKKDQNKVKDLFRSLFN